MEKPLVGASCAGSSFYGPGIEYLELWQDETWQQKGEIGISRSGRLVSPKEFEFI